MKKIAAFGAIAAAATMATPASADVLNLSGEIDYQCDLTLGGQNSTSLNLNNTNQNVGNFTITCNDPDGFTVVVDSNNDGSLDNGAFSVEYKWKIEAASGEPTQVQQGFQSPDNTFVVTGFEPGYANGALHSITAKPETNTVLPGGLKLSDTVTFTIDGNA